MMEQKQTEISNFKQQKFFSNLPKTFQKKKK